jgi:hypothetical protein
MSASTFNIAKVSYTSSFQVLLDNYVCRRTDEKLAWMEHILGEMTASVEEFKQQRASSSRGGVKRRNVPTPPPPSPAPVATAFTAKHAVSSAPEPSAVSAIVTPSFVPGGGTTHDNFAAETRAIPAQVPAPQVGPQGSAPSSFRLHQPWVVTDDEMIQHLGGLDELLSKA